MTPLSYTELSAILSEAEGPGLDWNDGASGCVQACPGDVVATVSDSEWQAARFGNDRPSYCSDRGYQVSHQTCPGSARCARRGDNDESTDAEDALSWMRAAGLVEGCEPEERS